MKLKVTKGVEAIGRPGEREGEVRRELVAESFGLSYVLSLSIDGFDLCQRARIVFMLEGWGGKLQR